MMLNVPLYSFFTILNFADRQQNFDIKSDKTAKGQSSELP